MLAKPWCRIAMLGIAFPNAHLAPVGSLQALKGAERVSSVFESMINTAFASRGEKGYAIDVESWTITKQ